MSSTLFRENQSYLRQSLLMVEKLLSGNSTENKNLRLNFSRFFSTTKELSQVEASARKARPNELASRPKFSI